MVDADERADGSDSSGHGDDAVGSESASDSGGDSSELGAGAGSGGDAAGSEFAFGLAASEQRRPGALVIVAAVVVMVAFVGLLAYSLLTRESMPMDVTTRSSIAAPEFTLSQLNGEGEVSLSDFEGAPIVVNFWASWCAPCRVEMPHLVEAHERYKDEGIRFIGVAIQDTNEDALAFIEEFAVPVDDGYIMVTDPDGEATINYGVGGLPVTFFIDRDGTVHTRWAGVVNGAILDERIAEITA